VAVRVFLVGLLLTFGVSGHAAAASAPDATVVPESTINEFIPVDRPIGDCISAAPKPGCGSEARGGWHQGLVMIALVLALVFVGWRIVVGVRRVPT
jgi:hypothetical protein